MGAMPVTSAHASAKCVLKKMQGDCSGIAHTGNDNYNYNVLVVVAAVVVVVVVMLLVVAADIGMRVIKL